MGKKTARPKFAKSSVETKSSDTGEITFIAARNVRNLNGWTYETSTLMAQDSTGDFLTLKSDWQDVAIPLMRNHEGTTDEKIGNINQARLVTTGDIEHVEMHAVFFDSEKAQAERTRVLDGELTDVSITTDWGSGYDDEDDWDVLKNAHIIEVSIVYAGAEPKAKILAKNSVDSEDEAVTEEEDVVEEETEKETLTAKLGDVEVEVDITVKKETEVEDTDTEVEEEELTNDAESVEEEKGEEEVKQPTNSVATQAKEATKEQVLNTLTSLAKSGAIRNMKRADVEKAVTNALTLKDGGEAYVVPDAVFTEILAASRDTDILSTFKTIGARRYTLMAEKRSEADLARAGKWSKGDQKAIQAMQLDAQKFSIDYIYKMQELSYADMQEDFGNLLYAFIRSELPQKVDEEEERAFIVGDGRDSSSDRAIDSIVSLDTAAEDANNAHVYKYDGSADESSLAALLNGGTKLGEDGRTHAVMSKLTLAGLRAAGLDTANGLPFSVEVVAGAIGVDTIFVRDYVPAGIVYIYVGDFVYRLTGGTAGESIEEYDIDYNNHKIEFIRPAGGGASGVFSAVKVILPETASA